LTTLLIGANDVVATRDAETYRSRLRVILGRLRLDGVAARHLVVISSPDWSRAPEAGRFGERKVVAALVEAYARVAREEAERAGAQFFDLVPLARAQAERGLFAADGLHFSAAAHEEWAVALDAAMQEWDLP
jgi:lysophospholipase L1-like esterase